MQMTTEQQTQAVVLLERAIGQLRVLNEDAKLIRTNALIEEIDRFTREVTCQPT